MMRYCLISLLFLFIFSDRLPAETTDPLAIVIGDLAGNAEQTIYFPGGTTFQVTNGSRQTLEPQISTPGAFVYEGDLILQVFPSYRPEQAQVFDLEQKRLRIFTSDEAARAAGFAYEAKRRNNASGITDAYGRYIGEVKAKTELTPSAKVPGTYHLRLTFSNGLVFTYEDGTVGAQLEGEALPVKSKYIIRTKLGTAKVSFDPEDGEVWYVFDPADR
ncbi:hypothetical protein [Flavilitoribacter nigricans]|nr:hypothetical protein [Flavilitoribacter nigricans]